MKMNHCYVNSYKLTIIQIEIHETQCVPLPSFRCWHSSALEKSLWQAEGKSMNWNFKVLNLKLQNMSTLIIEHSYRDYISFSVEVFPEIHMGL